jgi:hypothetical protein
MKNTQTKPVKMSKPDRDGYVKHGLVPTHVPLAKGSATYSLFLEHTSKPETRAYYFVAPLIDEVPEHQALASSKPKPKRKAKGTS